MRELRDDNNNLFEVFIRNADSDVPLRLESEKNTIWTCTIYKENYLSTDPTPGPSGAIQQRNVPTEDSIPTEDSVPAEESYSTEDSVPAEERIPAEDRDPSEDSVPAEKTLFSVRTEFVERVSDDVLNQLLDKLLEHRIINDGEMQSIRTKAKADKAREVIDTVRRKGTKPSALLIADLRKLDPCLSKVLKLS
uniref:CARD domain-containing protein n=1 Tax=Sander lucioperca TaxID=283035 RepID=A0A8C9Y793_SANLU